MVYAVDEVAANAVDEVTAHAADEVTAHTADEVTDFFADSRLEKLRRRVDKLIKKYQPDDDKYFYVHLYGVSHFCALLALRRGLNPGLAAACGMLHDIHQVKTGEIKHHAVEGATTTEALLKKWQLYTDDEIAVIVTAISRHSRKRDVHGAYDELLKDADVMHHCLYDPSAPVLMKEKARYAGVLAELGYNNKNHKQHPNR